MSAVATRCQCCKEDCGKIAVFDITLGALCPDCGEGVIVARRNLRKAGLEHVFTGACGDNGKDGVK